MNWDDFYRHTDLADLPWYPGEVDDLLQDIVYSGLLRGENVLDIGAGQGSDAIYLAGNGYRVTCLDVAAAARDMALVAAANAHVELDYVIGDALALPFTSDCFDVVIDRGCLNVCGQAERTQYAAEVARVLRQGGVYFYRGAAQPAVLATAAAQPSADEVCALFQSAFACVQSGMYAAKGYGGRNVHDMPYVLLQLR